MARGTASLLESIIVGLEDAARRMHEFASVFFEAVVRFMEDVRASILRFIDRLVAYARRFFSAAARLLHAFAKLSLFYIPSLVLAFIALGTGSVGAAAGALIWGFLVTLIGITYRHRT